MLDSNNEYNSETVQYLQGYSRSHGAMFTSATTKDLAAEQSGEHSVPCLNSSNPCNLDLLFEDNSTEIPGCSTF
jgi:hypothetical protein